MSAKRTIQFLFCLVLSQAIGCSRYPQASRDFDSFLKSKPALDYLARTPFSYELAAVSKGSSVIYTFQGQFYGAGHMAEQRTIKSEDLVWGASRESVKKIIERSSGESEEIFGNNEDYRFVLKGAKKGKLALKTVVLRGEATFLYAAIAFPFSIDNLGAKFSDLLTDSRFKIVDFSEEHHTLHGECMKLELRYQINGESIEYFVYFDIDSGLPIASGAPEDYFTFQYVEQEAGGKMIPASSEYWSVISDSPELLRRTIVLSFKEAGAFDDKICRLDYYGFPEPLMSKQQPSIPGWVFVALGGVIMIAVATFLKRRAKGQ